MVSTAAFAQECPDSFLGTKTLYHFSGLTATAVPKGYESVFINHVGRHGARHLTKGVNKSFAYQLLMKADSAGALTKIGITLKQMVVGLDRVEKDKVESISEEGKAELQEIGERMQADNARLFSRPLQVNVGATFKKRTKQSADAFLKGFKVQSTLHEYVDDTDLRFYDLSPAYTQFEEQGEWIQVFTSYEKKEGIDQIAKSLSAKIFNPDFAFELKAKDIKKFNADILGFASIVYSLKTEIEEAGLHQSDLNFKSLFTCEELEHLGKVDDAEDFLRKGPGLDINGIQVRIAVPLLVNYLKTTDEFIATGKYDLQLRFAHAETIAPFAAILGISTADKGTKNLDSIGYDWKAANVAPLSANIQWVLYKKQGVKDYLVKVLLNEKEVPITGLNTKSFPYYQYSDLKNLYINKLKKLGVSMNDDMSMYLKEVKVK